MPADNDSPVSSQYTDSAKSVEATRSATWWKSASWASKASDVEKTEVAALGPRRCLITNDPTDAQLCHLVAKGSLLPLIRRLQFAWGRKFSPNNRFNLLFLAPTFHIFFDNSRWVLIPERDLIKKIETKILAELAARLVSGRNVAWPDFRSEEWFPIKKNTPYKYIFVPLTLTQTDVAITRRDRESVPPARITYEPPEYRGFPLLSSHVHPYMVIMSVAPKVKKHPILFDRAHSSELRASIEFIYDTWMSSPDSAPPESAAPDSAVPDPGTGSSAPSRRSTRTRSSHPSNSRRSQHSSRSQRGIGGQSNRNPADRNSSGNLGGQDTTLHVDSDSAEFFGLDAEFGESDQEFDASNGTSRSPLSISVPEESITTLDHAMSPHTNHSSPKCDSHSPKLGDTSTHVDPTVRMPKDLDDWVNGANAAREDNYLSAIHNLLEQLGHYMAEPVRTPYEGDWHEWTSEFAPWDVLLPKRRHRGVLSSNDWVEVLKGQSLTRALEGNA